MHPEKRGKVKKEESMKIYLKTCLKLKMAFALLLTGFCFNSFADQPPQFSSEDIVWIDVRSEAEFQGGAVEGAINIPHRVIADHIGKHADKTTPLYLYCRSGGRAGKAKRVLEKLGYKNVVNLGGLEQAREVFPK